ncbi:hypothetical protein [Micromonospora cremea]|uniref:AraC-like ligand-binding domain-containing protein n=1 Tax=Micromonospora cremea TaxID=709881 RepID=UPI000A056940
MVAVTVRTDDVEHARAEVGRVFCPHRLTPQAGVRDVRLRMAARRVAGVGIIDLDYGQAVWIQPPSAGDLLSRADPPQRQHDAPARRP